MKKSPRFCPYNVRNNTALTVRNPLVSIILTSFNHAEFLGEAIDSVLNQTFQDFELIIIDDRSEDNSWNIINNYNDERIKAFRNQRRQRPGKGINEAILSIVRGKYVAIHHSDDSWLPDKLIKQVTFLEEHTDYGAVFTLVQVVDERGNNFLDDSHFYFNIFEQHNRPRHEWLRRFFFQGNCLCHPSVMVRRDCYLAIGPYDRRYGQLADVDMWVRLCGKYEILVLQEKLVKFRILDGERNLSGNRTDTHVRGSIELVQLLNNYKQIKSLGELTKIFPEILEFGPVSSDNAQNIIFLLARLSIAHGGRLHQIFGIQTLFDLLRDENTYRWLNEAYGVDFLQLISWTGQRDIYKILPDRNPESCQLFVDSGSGFNESESVIILDTTQKSLLVFSLKDFATIKALRFDPLDGPCVIEILDANLITENGTTRELSVEKSNAIHREGNKFFFSTNDPIIFIDSDFQSGVMSAVEITLNYLAVGYQALQECVVTQEKLVNELRCQNDSLGQQVADRDEQISQLKEWVRSDDVELESLKLQLKTREVDVVRFKEVVREKQGFADRLRDLLTERDSRLSEAQDTLAARDWELSSLYQSTSWRITAPIRLIGRVFRRSD